jgi:hypothetical protein
MNGAVDAFHYCSAVDAGHEFVDAAPEIVDYHK